MSKRIIAFLLFPLLIISSLFFAGSALAQSYSFTIPTETVNAFWNEDGTLSIDYVYIFNNNPGAASIEYVDLGIPNSAYDINTIYADVNGKTVTDISKSGYEGSGDGVAVGLGSYSIPAGKTGTVHLFIGKVQNVLYIDSQDKSYASADFTPMWFGSEYVSGSTDMTVTYHLPPGVKPEEPRWHESPAGGWPTAPVTSLDDNGRVSYTWHNASASGSDQYLFGASFPKQYVPDSAIVRPSPFAFIGTLIASFAGCLIPAGILGFIVLMIGLSMHGAKQRKMQYLPPKIAIEGHGIKRGLTAVEAGILMEQPMDKVMTMILFALVKKNAAQVTSRDPLQIQAISPQPEGLYDYEKDFLQAFSLPDGIQRQKALQDTMVKLIKSLSEKMRGFSSRETIAYYKDITERAWQQVEAAGTPEVKSQKYDEVMEWTMLDKNYNDRTRDIFHSSPVFVPMWWPRYDPGFGRASAAPTSTSGSAGQPSGGGLSMPQLPGADFAASIVGGVQTFSSKVVGNVSDFTNRVTNVTNPPPPPSTSSYHSSGGGGHSCACACACAGCACACAGGGR
jgi:hypothetical protein